MTTNEGKENRPRHFRMNLELQVVDWLIKDGKIVKKFPSILLLMS